MKRAVLLSSIVLVLASCSTRKTITKRTTITERIDTAISIPPAQYINKIPARELLKRPQAIDNERATILIHYDTIRDIVNVQTYIKPDTVIVEKIRTITKNETTTTRQPKKFKRWRWFAAGSIFTILSILILRIYVKTIF